MKTLLKLATLAALYTCVGWMYGQSVYVYPAAVSAPRGSYQSCTAIVTGVNNKTVTWSTTGGTLVGVNPSTANEPATIALTSTTAGTYTVTATTTTGAVTGTCVITLTASPTPVTTHPRLRVTSGMLAGLQAKATGGNVTYQAIRTRAITSYTTTNAIWSWSCNGGTGLPSSPQGPTSYMFGHAYLFSQMALINPSDPTYNWGCYGRDIITYMMDGFIANPHGYDGNTWSDASEAYSFTVDWLKGASAVNSGSGATATASLTGGTMNVPTVTAGGSGYTANGTQYWFARKGSSGCSVITGVDIVGMGRVGVNGSGAVAGTMTTITNATGCTTAPAIEIDSDWQLAHQFFASLAPYIIQLSYGVSAPTTGFNTSAQFNTGGIFDYTGQRATGNNYTESKDLYLTAAALTFNDTTGDDPQTPNTCSATSGQVCPDGTAYNLHAYWNYMAGGMYYKTWANLEDPNVAWQAYQAAYANLPTQPVCGTTWGGSMPCFGLGRGGESSEGVSYSYAASRLRWALNSVYTAGYADPIAYGPQLSLTTSSYWDLRGITDLAAWMGRIPTNPGGNPVGSITPLNYGDQFDYFRYPSTYPTQAAMLSGNALTSRTDGNNILLWTTMQSAWGGALGTSYGCVSQCGFNTELNNDYASQVAFDFFLALPAGDPVSSLPADPTTALPKDIYVAGNQHILARDSWTTASNTIFSYYSPNTAIDHEHQIDGRYDVWRKGEYITKGRAIFGDYNSLMVAAPGSNVMALQNNPSSTECTLANSCFMWPAMQNGGQPWHAEQHGLVNLLHNESPAYVAAIADLSNAYNTGAASDYPSYNSGITASRSLIYLRGTNEVVTFDRGGSGNTWTKALYQVITGTPTIVGNKATWSTRSGAQVGVFTSVLGGTLSNSALAAGGPDQGEDWEPSTSLKVTPAGTPSTVQFLSVLEWGDTGFTSLTPTSVASTAGQTFDGALVHDGGILAMFIRTQATCTGTTFPASGATTIYVADCTPNTTYSITGTGAPATATTDDAGVMTFAATGTGSIVIAAGGTPTVAQPTSLPTPGTYTTTQSVTLADATPSAAICFTTNGTTPGAAVAGTCDSSPTQTYSGAISVATTTTIKAIGTLAASLNSSVLTAAYTITSPAAATPTFSPAAGTYFATQTVAISTTTPSPTIYYTTDGSTPTTGSTVYSGPISVAVSETVKAIATASGFSTSAVGSAAYTITPPVTSVPTFTGAATITGTVTVQ